MPGDPLDIGTEDARKSLTQDMVSLYEGIRAGGAFDAKDITTDGSRASLQKAGNPSYQSAQFTPAGFKTKMQLLLTELNTKALNWAKGFYGHSTARYGNTSKR